MNRNYLYIAYRGTKTKQGFFARDFNINDTLSSHVGLLLYCNNDWYVYNVNDFKDGLSDFRKQKIEEFYDLEEERILSASFWKIEGIDSLNRNKILKKLEKYEKMTIQFDRYFTLDNPKKIYCSQFVCNILEQTDSVKFRFDTRRRKLKGIYKSYFRKDTLEYYPVDIFQTNAHIKKIKEWTFE
ncbi:MAG: hypothetical protein R2783_10150 [Gelidibacter sp.]